MSKNMGGVTTMDSWFSKAGGYSASSGMMISRICKACGKEKKSGTSHPKCSRILRDRYWENRK